MLAVRLILCGGQGEGRVDVRVSLGSVHVRSLIGMTVVASVAFGARAVLSAIQVACRG